MLNLENTARSVITNSLLIGMLITVVALVYQSLNGIGNISDGIVGTLTGSIVVGFFVALILASSKKFLVGFNAGNSNEKKAMLVALGLLSLYFIPKVIAAFNK